MERLHTQKKMQVLIIINLLSTINYIFVNLLVENLKFYGTGGLLRYKPYQIFKYFPFLIL